jgi:hypothetical protein
LGTPYAGYAGYAAYALVILSQRLRSTGIALNVMKAGGVLNQPSGQLLLAAATVNAPWHYTGLRDSCDQLNNCNSVKHALHIATEELINISLITEIDAVVANGPWHTFAPWHSLFKNLSHGVPARYIYCNSHSGCSNSDAWLTMAACTISSHSPLVPYGRVWYLAKDHAILGCVHELSGSQSRPLLFGPGQSRMGRWLR